MAHNQVRPRATRQTDLALLAEHAAACGKRTRDDRTARSLGFAMSGKSLLDMGKAA
jgi:hypothetical protein